MNYRIRYAAPFLALAILGCTKPGARTAPAKVDVPAAPKPEPKPQEVTPAKAPAEVIWSNNILNNAPGYLVPYKGAAEKADPEKALEQVRTELAKDPVTQALLKKLMRVETLDIDVAEGSAPEKFVAPHKPRSEDDGLIALYLQPLKKATIKGHVLLDFRYSTVASRSSTLTPHFSDASDIDAMRYAINDFLLRKHLGYFFVRGRSDFWEETKLKSEDELRKQLDSDIEQHAKKNGQLSLKMSK